MTWTTMFFTIVWPLALSLVIVLDTLRLEPGLQPLKVLDGQRIR